LQLGAYDYLKKPFEMSHVEAMLNRIKAILI